MMASLGYVLGVEKYMSLFHIDSNMKLTIDNIIVLKINLQISRTNVSLVAKFT